MTWVEISRYGVASVEAENPLFQFKTICICIKGFFGLQGGIESRHKVGKGQP